MQPDQREAKDMGEGSKLLKHIENHLQEQQAELVALRVMWMAFVSHLIGTNPDFAEEQILDLKSHAQTVLGGMSFAAATPAISAHAKKQTQDHVDTMFRDLESALSQARTTRGETGRH